ASPWEPLHVEHGFDREDSTVAVMAAEAPQVGADTRSRTAGALLSTMARSGEVVAHHKAVGLGDTALVFSPEHARTLADDGWSKARTREVQWRRLHKPGDDRGAGLAADGWWKARARGVQWGRLQKPVHDLVPGRDGGEGLSDEMLATFPGGARS